MSDTTIPTGIPPGGGRSDHATMREAAQRPVKGPASHDALAAGGGLEVPGGQPQAPATPADTTYEPIPGEREKKVEK